MPKLKGDKPKEVYPDKTEIENAEPAAEKPQIRLDVAVENTQIPAKRWPDIRCGICEFCGVMCKDPAKDDIAWHQYRHCPHYKGMEVRCIYCPAGTDMEDVIKGRIIKVRERLNQDGTGTGVLTMWCSDMKCEDAHWKRVGGSQRAL